MRSNDRGKEVQITPLIRGRECVIGDARDRVEYRNVCNGVYIQSLNKHYLGSSGSEPIIHYGSSYGLVFYWTLLQVYRYFYCRSTFDIQQRPISS